MYEYGLECSHVCSEYGDLANKWGQFCDLLFYISMTYLHHAASGEYIENQIVVYPIEIIVLFLP